MSGRAVYLYGIAGATGTLPRGAGGVDPRFPLDVVEHDGLRAIVSDVSLDEFGADALTERLRDRAWLEASVRAHEEALERALGAPLLPLRFGTIVSDRSRVVELLAAHHRELERDLARVAGHREWGVKVFADAARPVTAEAAVGAPDAEASPGRAFFARKQSEKDAAAAAAARIAEAADALHARFAAHAAEARVNPPQPRELSGVAADMVLNAAYLVAVEHEEALAAEVAAAAGEAAGDGFVVDLTGPWPPYNFVDVGGGG